MLMSLYQYCKPHVALNNSSNVKATKKFLIYQMIFFPMSRILHIAPISEPNFPFVT